jgi:hypothetical protein
MLIIYLILIVPISLAVAAIGDTRKIGFWSAFLWSAFASPLVGFLITILSDKKDRVSYDFVYFKRLAQEAEKEGNIKEAIEYYTDSLVHLENDYKNLDMRSEVARQMRIKDTNRKIDTLKSLLAEKTTKIVH